MISNRKTAVIVGVLFILGTVAGILSVVFTGSTLNAPDYLTSVSANESQIILGAFCVLIMGFALALVPVMMFPVLKNQNEALALGYVVFRGALETATYLVTAAGMLLLIPLSRAYGNAGAAEAAGLQTLGAFVQDLTHLPMTIFVFSLGALIFYSLLFQSRLIPRWLSVWGWIAILLHLATGLLTMTGVQEEFSVWNSVMNFPIFLQEMVMAGWMIAKGFTPPSRLPHGK